MERWREPGALGYREERGSTWICVQLPRVPSYATKVGHLTPPPDTYPRTMPHAEHVSGAGAGSKSKVRLFYSAPES